jgi:hypothetical protein
MKRNTTLVHYAEDVGDVHVDFLETSSGASACSHNQAH